MNPEADLALYELETSLRWVQRAPIGTVGDAADAAGRVRAVEVSLAEWRRGVLAEFGEGDGEQYAIVQSGKATRSYNLGRILYDALKPDPEASAWDVMREMVETGAARITFNWTRLQHYFATHDLEMVTAQSEVDPTDSNLDGPHVGVVWSTQTRVTAKTPEPEEAPDE